MFFGPIVGSDYYFTTLVHPEIVRIIVVELSLLTALIIWRAACDRVSRLFMFHPLPPCDITICVGAGVELFMNDLKMMS